jgi:hypothetical protein
MYSMLMDERRSSGGDRFVFTGVIVRTHELRAIRDELRAAAKAYAGSADQELKYVPDANSKQAKWCRERGLAGHDAKQAVFACLMARPKPAATIIVGIVSDPRGATSRISDAEVYSWGYSMALARFARFLMSDPDRGDGPHEVIVDTLTAEPHRFHELYAEVFEEGYAWLPSPIGPLKELGLREMLLSSVAKFTPPLWLPDHVGGAVDDWIKIERQVDAAEAGQRSSPRKGLPEGARRRVAQLLPNFRSTAPGWSIAGWPKDNLSNDTLSSWISRLRAQARADRDAAAE